MIKTLAYFQNFTALNGRDPLKALIQGAQTHGLVVQPNTMNADAAVIWSVLWYGRMRNNHEVFNHYRSLNRPVIIMDVGALRRNITWKVAINHMTAQGHYGHYDNLDYGRPQKLGVQLAQKSTTSRSILIAAQHAHSLQMQDWPNTVDWINTQISLVRNHSDRPIVIRPHPRNPIDVNRLSAGVTVQPPQKVISSYDSFDLDFGWHAIINHNSGVGIQSAIAGCTTVVDATSLAHPVSIEIANIDIPNQVDRDLWLTQICHTEYTVDELSHGLWYTRLEPFLHD